METTIRTTGRRKTSIARIGVVAGKGNITINERAVEAYFPTETLKKAVMQPLSVIGQEDKYDIRVNVKGGGLTGQAEATRLAIARALCQIDATHRTELKKEKLLTRDPRMVERKKYGQRKARKRFQFSKR